MIRDLVLSKGTGMSFMNENDSASPHMTQETSEHLSECSVSYSSPLLKCHISRFVKVESCHCMSDGDYSVLYDDSLACSGNQTSGVRALICGQDIPLVKSL